jgi:hypothetical protein
VSSLLAIHGCPLVVLPMLPRVGMLLVLHRNRKITVE